jgi:hypothetical protein
MISKIISRASRAACLAELTSDPKSFFNCPDLHGGVLGLPLGGKDLCEARSRQFLEGSALPHDVGRFSFSEH